MPIATANHLHNADSCTLSASNIYTAIDDDLKFKTIILGSYTKDRRAILKKMNIKASSLSLKSDVKRDGVTTYRLFNCPSQFATETARAEGDTLARFFFQNNELALTQRRSTLILTVNTAFSLDNKLLVLNNEQESAKNFLRSVQGQIINVDTACWLFCLADDQKITSRAIIETSQVQVSSLCDSDIIHYCNWISSFTNKFKLIRPFVAHINGCQFNCKGLPLNRLSKGITQLAKELKDPYVGCPLGVFDDEACVALTPCFNNIRVSPISLKCDSLGSEEMENTSKEDSASYMAF